MANEKFTGPSSVTTDLLRVLLTLKENIFKDLKVATLAKVNSFDEENHSCVVTPFPLFEDEQQKTISCLNFLSVNTDDVVLILFLDRNFIQNLKQYLSQQQLSYLKDKTLHSEKFGIVIQAFNEVLVENKYPIKWISSFNSDSLEQTLEMNDGTQLKNTVAIPIPSVPGQVSLSGDEITNSQLNALLLNPMDSVLYEGNVYYLSKPQTNGKLVYTCTDCDDNNDFTFKALIISVTTKTITYTQNTLK